MQLNGHPVEHGTSGSGDLVVKQDDLGAVGSEAFTLHGQVMKAADVAGAGLNAEGAGSNAQAAGQLKSHSFRIGSELSTTVSVWGSQVRTVLQGIAHISNHLDYTKKAHAENEAQIAATMRHRNGLPMSVSEISKFID